MLETERVCPKACLQAHAQAAQRAAAPVIKVREDLKSFGVSAKEQQAVLRHARNVEFSSTFKYIPERCDVLGDKVNMDDP